MRTGDLSLNGTLSDRIVDSSEELKPLVFVQGFNSSIIDMDIASDGYLYFTTYYRHDASIYRVVPKETP